MFTKKRTDMPPFTVRYGGAKIQRVNETRLFGMTIDKGLNFNSHAMKAIPKANDVTHRLRLFLTVCLQLFSRFSFALS